jgi:ABC-type transporter Mla MlaB component
MVLRIERALEGQLTTLRLSGRLQAEHLADLKAQIDGSTRKVVLNLEEVKLVDQEAVSFLAACEANGVRLIGCSPYVRNWIARERAGGGNS